MSTAASLATKITAMTQAHAIRIHRFGGPEELNWEPVDVPSPGPGEALIEQTVAGLNYIDVYFRTGLYRSPHFRRRSGTKVRVPGARWATASARLQ